MRRRSPSYSPPRRGYGGRERSPPRGRYGGYKDASCGLLVRNIPKGSRPEDLRVPFEQFGRVRDVYLPRDYYSGEPRGFGFVQYLNPFDAAEAKKYMDRRMFNGREITVVFAEENRKKPEEMRMKERGRGRTSYGSRRSPNRGYTPSRSPPPRHRSPSPRKGRYSRSNEDSSRRERYESMSPPPRGRGQLSRSPDEHEREREQHSPDEIPDAPPTRNGQGKIERKRGRRSESAERSYSPRPKDGLAKSPSKQNRLRSPSPSPPPQSQRYSRSRSKSWRESRSPSSRSPPPRRQRQSGLKSYSSRASEEERPLRGESQSPQ